MLTSKRLIVLTPARKANRGSKSAIKNARASLGKSAIAIWTSSIVAKHDTTKGHFIWTDLFLI